MDMKQPLWAKPSILRWPSRSSLSKAKPISLSSVQCQTPIRHQAGCRESRLAWRERQTPARSTRVEKAPTSVHLRRPSPERSVLSGAESIWDERSRNRCYSGHQIERMARGNPIPFEWGSTFLSIWGSLYELF